MRISICISPKKTGGWSLSYKVISIELKENGERIVTYTSSLAGVELVTRELGKRGSFPLPPDDEAARWRGTTHEPYCVAGPDATIHETASAQVALGQADAETRKNFGNYLTEVLLGAHLPKLIPPTEAVEIYLRAEDSSIQHLPWELIYGGGEKGDEPLAASSSRTFAVVRVVESKAGSPKTVPLALPLNVLFVVGEVLDDSIRPGAEYMALLRRVAGDQELRIANMNTRLLLQATPDEIKAAVADFQPSVVHFICHGDFDGTKATLRLSKLEGKKKSSGQQLDANALLELLTENSKEHRLPAAIVLNACHTADAAQFSDRKDAYRSFAATLVAGGVPVVLGMAGEVADGACRIFTCEVYQALLKGESLVIASGRGRRAALRAYSAYRDTNEWARPTLFVSSEVASTPKIDTTKAGLGDAAAQYIRLNDPRALCGRMDSISAFESLLGRVMAGRSNRFVLGFGVTAPIDQQKDGHKAQYGKTRLLEEIAVRFALAGVAPVMLWNEDGVDKPTNPLRLALHVSETMNRTRVRFGADTLPVTAMMKLILKHFKPPSDGTPEGDLSAMNQALGDAKNRGGEIEVGFIQKSLADDFERLVSDLKDKGITHAALLIDDLHTYEGCINDLPVLVGEKGFGKNGAIVPLVFTYFRNDPANGERLAKFVRERGQYETLAAISESEEILANRQYLLTNRKLPLGVGSKPDARERIPDVNRAFRDIAMGIPSWWDLSGLHGRLSVYRDFNVLVDADDEQILEQFGK